MLMSFELVSGVTCVAVGTSRVSTDDTLETRRMYGTRPPVRGGATPPVTNKCRIHSHPTVEVMVSQTDFYEPTIERQRPIPIACGAHGHA